MGANRTLCISDLVVLVPGLLAYEYVITFGREVDLFWKRKATMASVLFGVNRYLPMVVAALDLPYPVSPSMRYTVSVML